MDGNNRPAKYQENCLRFIFDDACSFDGAFTVLIFVTIAYGGCRHRCHSLHAYNRATASINLHRYCPRLFIGIWHQISPIRTNLPSRNESKERNPILIWTFASKLIVSPAWSRHTYIGLCYVKILDYRNWIGFGLMLILMLTQCDDSMPSNTVDYWCSDATSAKRDKNEKN